MIDDTKSVYTHAPATKRMDAALKVIAEARLVEDVKLTTVLLAYGITLASPALMAPVTDNRIFYLYSGDSTPNEHHNAILTRASGNQVKYTRANKVWMALGTHTRHSIVTRHKYGMARILDEIPDRGGRQVPSITDTDPYVVLLNALPGDYISHPGLGDDEFYVVIPEP